MRTAPHGIALLTLLLLAAQTNAQHHGEPHLRNRLLAKLLHFGLRDVHRL
jgi:hypothetical protein